MPDALVVRSGSFRKGWSTRKAIILSRFATLAISKNTGESLATAGTINHRPRDTIMKTLARIVPSLSLALAFSVQAQSSVTLYGDLDLGGQYLTHAGPTGGTTIGMQSGNEQPSRFGITGTEDLGGGYAAIFRLESGFNVGTGNYTIPGTAIDRYAYVGLSAKNLGTLTLGRQRSLLFEQSLSSIRLISPSIHPSRPTTSRCRALTRTAR